MTIETTGSAAAAPLAKRRRPVTEATLRAVESVLLPMLAIVAGLALFGVFIAAIGKSPVDLYSYVWRGGFGTAFSLQNTMQRAAPLLLTALCVALPAQLGLVMIGGEGAFVLGGLAAAWAGAHLAGAGMAGTIAMACAGAAIGALWIGIAGALRNYRGVNETISSLLLAYLAVALFNHLVEGPLRDPSALNKPSTPTIDASLKIGSMFGLNVHWGFLVGCVACLIAAFVVDRTTFGFAARIAGGNARAAAVQGLPVSRLILAFAAAGGAAAGLAGAIDVAAVQGSANASLIAGYGYAGILIAFLARQNPLAIIPMAILIGGIQASGGLVQRRMQLPDATVQVLQGLLFVAILVSETFNGRLLPRSWLGRPDP